MARWQQLLCVFFLLISVGTMFPAYSGFQAKRYDQQALVELQKLRDAIYRDAEVSAEPAKSSSQQVKQLFLVEPGETIKFPTSGEEIMVKKGVKVPYLIRLKRFHNSITVLITYHPQGTHEYRWVDIYGNRRLQKIVRQG